MTEQKAGSQFEPERTEPPALDIPGMVVTEAEPPPSVTEPDEPPPPPPPDESSFPPSESEVELEVEPEAEPEPSEAAKGVAPDWPPIGDLPLPDEWPEPPPEGWPEERPENWPGNWPWPPPLPTPDTETDEPPGPPPIPPHPPEPAPEPEPYPEPDIKSEEEIMSQVSGEAEKSKTETERKHTEALTELSGRRTEEKEKVEQEVRRLHSDLEKDFQARLKEIRGTAAEYVKGVALPSVVATMRVGQAERFIGGEKLTAEEIQKQADALIARAEKEALDELDRWFRESKDYLDKQKEQVLLGIGNWEDAHFAEKRAAIENAERAVAQARSAFGSVTAAKLAEWGVTSDLGLAIGRLNVAVAELVRVDASTKAAREDGKAARKDRRDAQKEVDVVARERQPYLDRIDVTYAAWKVVDEVIYKYEAWEAYERSPRDVEEPSFPKPSDAEFREAEGKLPEVVRDRDEAVADYNYARPSLDSRQSAAMSAFNAATGRVQEAVWAEDEFNRAKQAKNVAESDHGRARTAVEVAGAGVDRAAEQSKESDRTVGFYAEIAEREVGAMSVGDLIVPFRPSIIVPKVAFGSIMISPIAPPRRWKTTRRVGKGRKEVPPSLKGVQ